MRINTNVASLTAQESAANTNKNVASSLEKLGSGLRINKAADDASGMSIADKLRTQASSLGQGISNANSASAMIQIADKAMAEQSNILDIVKTKLIQASTSTTSADGRESIRKDVSKLLEQFDAIASQTNYNGTTLLQKSSTDTAAADEFSFQLGEDASFDVSIQATKASNTADLGGGSDAISMKSETGADVLGKLDAVSTSSITETLNNTMNNIGVAGSQTINVAQAASTTTDTSVVISTADLEVTGLEKAGTTAGVQSTSGGVEGGLDINVSGQIGGVIINTADTEMMLSSQSESVQTAVKAIADAEANLTYDSDTDTLNFDATGTFDFGDIEFSNVQIRDNAAGTKITFNAGEKQTSQTEKAEAVSFTVTNNHQDTINPLKNQLNIGTLTAGVELTGGKLLGDLKDLGTDGLTMDVANSFMSTIDEAMTQLNANRSDFGSTQNQIESSIRNMQTTQTNLKAAESVIRDVDYAAESANFNKQNIISQAGTYAMSQANSAQQNIMRLLQ